MRAVPDGCLTLRATGLAVAGQGIALPDGLCLRAAAGGPLAIWTPGSAESIALRALADVPRLAVPAAAVEATDVALTLTGSDQRIDLAASATVRHTARPAAVAPLGVTAKAAWLAGQPVAFSATGTGPLRVTAEGTHDTATGKGHADLRLPKLAFAADGGTLEKAFPVLTGTVAATAGGVAAKGRIDWGEGAPTSSAEVLLDGVAASVGPVSVVGVNGTVRLSSLLPPVAPAGQTLAVSLLDVGIPLTDGTLRFGYGRDGRVAVERAEWRWAGGVLRAKPFALSPQAPKGLVELEAEGIDFAQLLALAAVDGLDATGRLRGQLPVRIDGGSVRIDNGVLESSAPGAVRYDPAEPPSFLAGEPGSATDLLRGALTDFRYQELRLTVNGTAGGELVVGLSLQGANPDFYDGHPVKLNLNLSGALDRILRQSIDAYRIPEAVRDRMTEFGLKPP
ncbi:YdbH domain-containing protein [Azospirillum sp. RWY-5-1]|uniref:YdbH domain-containing protein n=1 Tax=Azospirillum oleiclasticum TaxID=2735135 RepID=A0ABX2T9F8_9PROT|nr:YdbH domain-containing protein [Azospirillum oleiclasticum]NYZ19325.1 YdbH domain-containing protein [Azospirillum oleiclasticum]